MMQSSLNSAFNAYYLLHELATQFCSGNKKTFDNVLLVGVQHVLGTTVDMLSVMHEFGLKEAIIGGKNYSTHMESAEKIEKLGFTYVQDGCQLGYGRFDDCMQEVVHRIWFEALRKIRSKKFDLLIILDDGADLLRATPGIFFDKKNTLANKPDLIVGVEQTRGGTNHPLFNGLPFPIIDVAGSYVKTNIEYPKVASLIAKQISSLINEAILRENGHMPIIGVLGYGCMGKAIARECVAKRFPVIVYDKNYEVQDNLDQITYYNHSAVMISNADIIIGCTGADVTLEPANLSALLYSKRNKWLISAGSKDHEFYSLLGTIQNETKGLGYLPHPFTTIHYENHVGAILNVIRGGFPVNFTNEEHSVAPEHIWPTRAALMLTCLLIAQSREKHMKYFLRNINVFALPERIQILILKRYCELNPSDIELARLCNMPHQKLAQLVANHSDGEAFGGLVRAE